MPMMLGMLAKGLGKSLLKGRKKKVKTQKLMNREGKERGGQLVKKEERGGALAVQPSTGLVPTAQDLSPVSKTPGESDIVIIRKQVIQVRDILKDTYSSEQAERVNRRKALLAQKRDAKENKLEKPKVEPKAAKSGIKMPNLGLGIGNFLTWLIAGLIFNKLKDLMPALKKIFGILKPIVNFIGGVLKKSLEFVIGFIDLSYAGVEKLREGIVSIGGEGAGKLFDKFGKLFTQVINAGLIAALIASRVGLFKKPKGPKGPKGPKSKFRKGLEQKFKKSKVGKFFRNQRAGFLKLTRKISRSPIGRTLNALRPKNVGKFIMEGGVDKALKSGVKNVGKIATKGLKTATKLGKSVLKTATPAIKTATKTVTKLAKTATKTVTTAAKTAAKTTTKTVTTAAKTAAKTTTKGLKTGLKTGLKGLKSLKKIVSPIVKKIPFIGALLDFALNYFVFKEPLGKSAFMAIGAGVGAWLGGMLGTLIPVPFAGTAIGAFIGGAGGDMLAGAIYDAIFKDKKEDKKDKKEDKKKISKEFKIGKKTLDLSKLMGGLSREEYDDLDDRHRRVLDRRIRRYASQNPIETHDAIKSNKMTSSAEGLDTKPSYGSGGFITIENTTTYIQPIEV